MQIYFQFLRFENKFTDFLYVSNYLLTMQTTWPELTKRKQNTP